MFKSENVTSFFCLSKEMRRIEADPRGRARTVIASSLGTVAVDPAPAARPVYRAGAHRPLRDADRPYRGAAAHGLNRLGRVSKLSRLSPQSPISRR
ncbi:hypothetical protein, partial [Humibacter sp.]|uniref:hypothetical protein n=1 Tax=Humibacter sp. TaxID=1940291 RepID=UPI002BC2290B